MIRGVLAFLIAFIVTTANAAPRYWGIDQLAGAKYTKEIISNHPDGFALGIFTQKELFGDGFAAVDKVLAKRNIPLVRYNLRWSDTHTFTKADFPKIVAEAKRGLRVINKYPNVECEVSGATEHKLNQRDAEVLADAVLGVLPERCVYVNNPWTGYGAFITPGPRKKNEVHGKDAQRPKVGGKYNWSADGSDVFDINITGIKNRLQDADVFFFWTSQNNGRRNAGDSTPRPQRKFWPTGNLIKAMAHLATNEGPASLPKNYLYKSKSDQHVVPPAPRELKPVLILPPNLQVPCPKNPKKKCSEKVKNVNLRRGNTIFKGAAPQPYEDGRIRVYFNQFGFQMGPELNVMVNGKKQGTVSGGFRHGTFR